MSKHAPGPWRFVKSWTTQEIPLSYSAPGYCENPGISDANGKSVVSCDEYDVFDGEGETREANIRLLLAAPDLLAALQDLVAYVEEEHERSDEEVAAMDARVMAAIAKATGGA